MIDYFIYDRPNLHIFGQFEEVKEKDLSKIPAMHTNMVKGGE